MKKISKQILPTKTNRLEGDLHKKNSSTDLKKFAKNQKQKKIVIGAIVGLILLVGGITLYRTFALYEEKKEFNVLTGKVPDYSIPDIKLAFTINGQIQNNKKFPSKGEGYGVESVTCKNKVTAEWNNQLWGLVNIDNPNENNAKIECTINFKNGEILADVANLGDYVSYTPSNTSYKIGTNLTGHSSEQEINPSELNLWRVIKKNEDGSVDAVSENVSSADVYFRGKTGYGKIIGSLNEIASQYETEGITSASRHMGYDGGSSTVSITDASSWTDSTNDTNSPNGSTREKAGGGDIGYKTDTSLVKTALETLIAFKKNATSNEKGTNYYLASRNYIFDNTGYFTTRFVNNSGVISHTPLHTKYMSQDSEFKGAIRPIVTFKQGIIATKGENKDDKQTWIVN